MNVTVLGSGGWGTALALLLLENGNQVTLWSYFQEESDRLKADRENPMLKGVTLPEELTLTADISCVSESDVVVLATPSFAVRSTAKQLAPLVKTGTILVSVGKGIEKGTSLRLSQIIGEEVGEKCPVVVLCGPTHAEEVGRRIPSAIVAASENRMAAHVVQDLFMNSRFRVYASPDVVGVEIGAALKNVIALAAGVSDGIGYGDNAKAAIITSWGRERPLRRRSRRWAALWWRAIMRRPLPMSWRRRPVWRCPSPMRLIRSCTRGRIFASPSWS